MVSERLVLIDGSSMIFRAFFAMPGNLSTKSGLPTNAIFGFTTMFRKLLSGRTPTYGAVIFDPPGPTFREARYADYKAQRPEMASDLVRQLPFIDQVVTAYRFPIFRVPGFEADDVIGTLTKRARAAGIEVLIVSGDKDFAQLIGDEVRMLDAMRDITYDAELVRKKWGVVPEKFVDYLALVGDSIDNIPGVPGIGQKGAAKLLETYGDLENILAHAGDEKGRTKTALETFAEQARLSRDLARIDIQVPLEFDLEDLRYSPPDQSALNTLFRELEFFSLLAGEARSESAEPPPKVAIAKDPAALDRAIESLAGTPIAVYPLLSSAEPMRAEIIGIAIASEHEAHYFPLFSAEGGPGPDALADLAPIFENRRQPLIFHDAKRALVALGRRGIDIRGILFDTMLASFLIEPTKVIPHALDQVVKEYLEQTIRRPKDLRKSLAEADLGQLPAEEAGGLAGEWATAIAKLYPILKKRLAELEQTAQLIERDLPLSYVLAHMERRGIKVDPENLDQMGREFRGRLAEWEKQIHALAGRNFNIGSTKQLAEVLFEELKLPVIKKNKTGYSTDAEVLERLAPKHEIARHLLEHRKLAKLINTYTDVLSESVNPETGRIHATFEQTVGATGRLISTNPDLQRTPIKTPEGRRIREAFIAEPGNKLISADWSQIELRILAHFSRDSALVEAFRNEQDVHRRTGGQLFGVAPEDVTPEQRGVAKTVNFATIYGQGANALGQILSIPKKEAQRYIDQYFEYYSGVRRWLDRTIETALETGSVSTLFGRRRFIPELSSHNVMIREAGKRIAANTPIQGSAADLSKQAMLDLSKMLREASLTAELLLQIHDEFVLEVPEAEVEHVTELVRTAMEEVYPLVVPLVVEIGVGANWGEAH